MEIHVELTREAVARPDGAVTAAGAGAWVEFGGVVRNEENGKRIAALEYECYDTMAIRVMREILGQLAARHACLAAWVIHRVGLVPVGEEALWVGVAAVHRNEALSLVTEFLDRLKENVPIWKCRALSAEELASIAPPTDSVA